MLPFLQGGFDATRESVSLPLLPAPWQEEPMDVLKLQLSAMVQGLLLESRFRVGMQSHELDAAW